MLMDLSYQQLHTYNKRTDSEKQKQFSKSHLPRQHSLIPEHSLIALWIEVQLVRLVAEFSVSTPHQKLGARKVKKTGLRCSSESGSLFCSTLLFLSICFFLRISIAAMVIIFFLEFFAFFRSHGGKFRFKPIPPVSMRPAAVHPPAKTVEKNVREDKKPDRLPECDERPVENIGDKSVP